MVKDNTELEVVLVVRADSIDDAVALIRKVATRIKNIPETTLEDAGGEESGAETYCAGWYNFNVRDRTIIPDGPTATLLPLRVSTDGC